MTELIISSTVLIIVVLTLRHLLKGRISPRLQYAMWGLVLLRLLVPVNLPDSAISVLNIAGINKTAAVESGPAPAFPQEELVNTSAPRDLPAAGLHTPPAAPKAPFNWDRLLCLAWYMGMAAVGFCLLFSNLSFARKLRKTRTLLPMETCRLKVYVAENVSSSCLYGLFIPAVYVTPDVASDQTRLNHVLAHEISHHRHGDHIWSVLRALCLAVYWFNPLVWLAAGVSRRDAELACDEAAILRLGEENRMAYGRTLIGLTCEKRGAMKMLYCATTITDSKKGIKERIALIAKKPKTAVLTLIVILPLLAAAVGCTFTGAKPGEEAGSAPTEAAVSADKQYSTVYDGKKPLSKEELQQATHLTVINVDDLDFLRDATKLTHLSVGSSDMYTSSEEAKTVSGDLSALSGLKNLLSVNLALTNVTGDIGSLRGLEKLQSLVLDNTQVSGDLGALKELPKLKQLSLTYDNITGELGELSGMSSLETIFLSGVGISGDLGALGGLANLRQLYFYTTPNVTGDISALKGLPLKYISFFQTGITADLGTVSSFQNLDFLELVSSKVTGDLSALSGTSSLTTIYLEGSGITGSLGALRELPKLSALTLDSAPNVTGGLGMLKGLDLRYIQFVDTAISVDLRELREFPDLLTVRLDTPNVTGDLSALSGFKILRQVNLKSPDITGDIGVFSKMINLEMLGLVSPNITGDLGALGGLAHLTYIDLSTCGVSGDLGALKGLLALQYLDVSSTGVTGDTGALAGLEHLKNLDCTDTNVTGKTKAIQAA